MAENNKAIVERINTTLAKGDFETYLAACADDVQWTIVGEPPLKGKEAIRQFMSSMSKENKDTPAFTVDAVFGEGEFVAAHGPMKMKDKEGKLGSYRYCDIYRFRNGKIAEQTSYVVKTEAQTKATGA
jgi:ketosteroid isomerase-like protein